MSTIGIVQIHEVITRYGDKYCCICFRPAGETKLVEPVHIKGFISKLTRARAKPDIRVCYICEGLALSAMRFVKAVELANRVSELFTHLTQTQWLNILTYINEPSNVPKVLNRTFLTHRAVELDASLRSTPRYELRRTDTLVVQSPQQMRQEPPAVMQHANPVIPTVMAPLTPVVPMAPHVTIMTTGATVTPATIMGPGALVAPPGAIVTPGALQAPGAPVPPPGANTLTQKLYVDQDLQVVRVVNNETKQIILHPMVRGTDGSVYVPSLNLQILDNGVLKSVYVPTSTQMSPSTLTPAQKDPKPRKYKNTKDKSEKNSDYYNFLVSQMEQKQTQNSCEVIKMDDNLSIVVYDDASEKKRKRREGSVEKTLSEVQLLLNKNAEGSCEVRYEIIDDDDDSNVTKDSRIDPASIPVERTDGTVDWEDKIPMDVISFMDATDPHPEERIMQPPPMGVISDVRSVPNETIECIDLC